MAFQIKNKIKNKQGISEIVSYVLLISLALVMAGIIFTWMKFYAEKPFPEESCPEVSIVIEDYFCNNEIKMLNLTVQNMGRFDIDGFTVKINNGTTFYSLYLPREKTGGVPLNYIPANLSSGDSTTESFNYLAYAQVNEIELEAKKGKALCENSIIKQKVEDCN